MFIIHSCIDFDLSFYCMMVAWIELFAIINKEKQKEIKMPNVIVLLLILIIGISGIVFGICENITRNSNKQILPSIAKHMKEKEYDKVIELTKK